MNTPIPTRAVSRDATLDRSTTLAPFHIEAAILLLLGTTLAVGAYLSFPLYDDGWMTLMLRESGRHSLAQYMGDRPIFGFLLETIARFGAANRLVFVLTNAVLWMAFAIESGMLFGGLFPEFKNFSIVAAGLTLAPIVIQTQLSTVLVAIPANLATIFGYGAILILLRDSREQKPTKPVLLAIAALIAALGVALSEYGVATNLIGCTILVGMGILLSDRMVRRRLFLRAAFLFALTGSTYLFFTRFADFSVRPDVAPAHILQRGFGKWIEIPFGVIAGTWHSLIGAYATAFGDVNWSWDSKSTIIGVLFGFLTTGLFLLGIKNRGTGRESGNRLKKIPGRLAVLIPAILVGLVPFSLMGRGTTLVEFGSRFRIPIMPVAATLTLGFALYIVRPTFRWIPVTLFGFIVGYSSLISTYTAIEQARTIAAIQGALKPFAAHARNYTVAVVPFRRFESELTANIASTWPVEFEKRLWVVADDAALLQFGDRRDCTATGGLDIKVRGLTRSGKLDQILWVETPPGKPVLIEQYCQTPN